MADANGESGFPPGSGARVPPHSLEAEQAVLGALLLDGRVWFDLSDQLVESDFYTAQHRLIWTAVGELAASSQPCDLVTLIAHLRHHGRLDEAGGLAYLGNLAADAPGVANVRAYAGIVRERATLRALIAAGHDISRLGFEPEGRRPEMLVESAEQTVFAIRDRNARQRSGFHEMPSLMAAVEDRLETLRRNPGALAGLPTGFDDLDGRTTGLHPGDLVIVAGRPGMGKTSFAMNIAEHVALVAKRPVAVFSMEMSAEQLALRVLSSFGRIDQQHLRSGELDDRDWKRVASAGGMLRAAPLLIDDTGALSPLDLGARARRAAAKGGLALIVVDYIQLMQVPSTRENRTNEISEISRSLKALAKELAVPVVAISQLSRSVESRENKRPRMSDLRESGGIEQDADLILFVYRDEYYNPDSVDQGTAEIILAKQRNGPTGVIKAAFLGRYTKFENLAPQRQDGDSMPPANYGDE